MVLSLNDGHSHIFLILKLQTRVALKDHDTSDLSFWYPLELNDWAPKHIKVNIQIHAWTQFCLLVDTQDSNKMLSQKIEVNFLMQSQKVEHFEHPKASFKY